jgi:hypothetical protein
MADSLVVVGRDTGDILDFFEVVANLFGLGLDAFHDSGYGFVDAALYVHRVCTGGHVLKSVGDDCLCEHGSGRCAVAGIVACL